MHRSDSAKNDDFVHWTYFQLNIYTFEAIDYDFPCFCNTLKFMAKKLFRGNVYGAGDDLLQEVAGRITGCLHEISSVMSLADKIIVELRLPFHQDWQETVICASISIGFYPGHSVELDQLIIHADQAICVGQTSRKRQIGRERNQSGMVFAP